MSLPKTVSFSLGAFAPRYYPKVRVSKERNLQSQQDLCEGQYMYDLGGKNRRVHITGFIHRDQFPTFNSMLEQGVPMEMVAEKWSGEVLIKRGELSGRFRWDGSKEQWMCDFSMDLVSTGRDERGTTNYGIIGGSASGGGGGSGQVMVAAEP
jgi:hypothetical protein